MKREFNMSFKQDIIDGKVKVATDCGEPVEIVKWNCKGNYPILAVIDDGDTSDPCFYDEEGLSSSKKERIYVLTDEPEPDDEKIRKFLKLIIGEWSYDDLSAKGFKKENIIAWLEKRGEKGIVFRDTFGYEEGRQKGQEEGIMLVLYNPQKYGLEKQEQEPAWSDWDRILQDSSISYLCNLRDTFETKGWDKEPIQKCINWLKSLRPQNTWKPSDEQMKALDIALKAGIQLGTWEEKALRELKEQLKKL